MADSDITVDSLVITPGFGQTFAEWTYTDPNVGGFPYAQIEAVELWAATANDRADGSFAKVAEGLLSAIHRVDDGLARWYWAKARTKGIGTGPIAGQRFHGEWYPTGATSGVAAGATAGAGWQKFPSGIIQQFGEGVSGADGYGSVTFPVEFATTNYRPTLLVQGDADDKLTTATLVGFNTEEMFFQVNSATSGSSTIAGVSGVKVHWTAIGR